MATVYVVATPIGHLGDLTLRAIETLRAVPLVLAEDTRRARGLLAHLGIAAKRLVRLDENAPEDVVARVVDELVRDDLDAAFVSDAGTPVVSDPGDALVRAAIAAGVAVVPIPGPSAVTAALSVSGLGAQGFRFIGFLPRSGEARRVAVARVRDADEPVVLFEAGPRVTETLADLARAMPGRRAVVARELTKLHEELVRGTLDELAEVAPTREWLGEVTMVLGAWERPAAPAPQDLDVDAWVDAELAGGRRAKELADELAHRTGVPRREAYARVLARKR